MVILFRILGLVIILIGIAGLVLPIVPGIALIALGMLIIFKGGEKRP